MHFVYMYGIRRRGMAGLVNLGNICFPNSAVQSLLTVTDFASIYIDKKNFPNTVGEMTKATSDNVMKMSDVKTSFRCSSFLVSS